MHEQSVEILLGAKERAELFPRTDASQRSSETPWLPLRIDPVGSAEEAELVQRVFMLPADEMPRVVAFCGVGQIDGAGGICTRAALNLANQTGSSVCVVEGNFQAPSLHQYFSLDNSRGLSDAVLESGPIREFIFSFRESNLSVLSGGSRCGKTQALWKSERLQHRIAELRQEFSYVLIYGPPVRQKHMDAVLLGQIADGVILILESMVTRREAARTAKESLFAANVNVLGAVLNNHRFSIPETLYRRL
jgi:Mrp family chromosome partitioning ATPase